MQNKVELSGIFPHRMKEYCERINKHLKDLELVAETHNHEKDHEYRYDTFVYILNPDSNIDELIKVIDMLDSRGVELHASDFDPRKIAYAKDNEFLVSQGYGGGDTYLMFPVWYDSDSDWEDEHRKSKIQKKRRS